MRVDFTGSPRPTVGVEWEFALVDKVTRDLSNTASELFEAVHEREASVVDESKLHKELLRNTVELVTGICDNVGEAVDDLATTMRVVRRTADALGVDLYAAGTHPFAQWSLQLLTPGHRYEELIARTQWWGRQMLIWGLHVHVGVRRRDQVLPIVSSLLNHFPHLQALSASSPLWSGQDTGYASNRAMMFQQLPTAGLPFQFQTWAEYEGYVADAFRTGVIEHINDIRWDIRPSPALGTVEVRVCDGVSNLRELSALTALTHCLVVDLERRLDAGEELPTMPPWHVQENKWRAARYGLDAEIILDAAGNERLVTDDLDDLLERLSPLARELACEEELRLVAEIPKTGASYERQRRVLAENDGNLVAVVDSVVAELED
ncbi:glutamate--cysteine ligase [Nocardioides iriomotensis]|uniref:Putative glutamate--cysteine ligase 2 n=1 Tax=Nocardioides iriomotensis TaxID=715784 RepID=A0A4Q5IX66_9ACTN|nr:glutamate--cysteine ligase [Nocardioides iriomotensis]RYU10692.1 glutamate--cysteine ligase [Nocardioides iriomotensis]